VIDNCSLPAPAETETARARARERERERGRVGAAPAETEAAPAASRLSLPRDSESLAPQPPRLRSGSAPRASDSESRGSRHSEFHPSPSFSSAFRPGVRLGVSGNLKDSLPTSRSSRPSRDSHGARSPFRPAVRVRVAYSESARSTADPAHPGSGSAWRTRISSFRSPHSLIRALSH
jgi:hypothetical protein